jgi:adenylate cyclase
VTSEARPLDRRKEDRRPVRLEDLSACFQGVIPSIIATCDRDGEPNVTYLSQVYYVDPAHVALSCQFFNKTRRNVDENPYAAVNIFDPRTFEIYRLELRFDHLEKEGPLFDTMAARIQVIASHSGMKGIFRLLSADIYEVESIRRVEEFVDPLAEPPLEPTDWIPASHALPVPPPLSELRGLQAVSGKIARAEDLDGLLSGALAELEALFSFAHSMVLVPDDSGRRLVTIASRGYGEEGVGAEIAFGDGVFGIAAAQRRMVRVAGVAGEMRYGRTIRERFADRGRRQELGPELPLPGLPDARAQLALPLLVGDCLVGVLGFESRDPLAFDEWDEAFLQIVANQIAMGIERMQEDAEEVDPAAPRAALEAPEECDRHLRFVYYRNDETIFVGDEYLVRNVPAKIFWKILNQYQQQGRTEFTNRELRLDAALGLPGYKDNLESRLILLRKRLVEKCPWVRMVPVRRGRFALEIETRIELVERDSA